MEDPLRYAYALLLIFVFLLGCRQAGRADGPTTFDNDAALQGWEVAGGARVDPAKERAGAAGGALRVGAGGKAQWRPRATDGSGKVEFWVYDDGSKAANPKERRVGPRWGLLQSDGRVLAVGALYAPYLSGDTTYSATDSDQKNWFTVQYLGVPRQAGWRRWTFDFDPEKGLRILVDGKDVNAARPRFDWNRTQMRGFCGVAFFGDAGKGDEHTFWVDDLSVTLGEPMKAQPVAPPPPPPVVPESDPAPEKPATLLPAVRGRHPRLLFTAEDVPALRRLAEGEGKVFFEQVLKYLPACQPPDHTRWQTDATDAQRQGIWRLPTVALHYVITGDRGSLDKAAGFLRKFLDTPDWETGEERNSGMAAANILAGAALAYDWLYNDLDPALREAMRKKLLLQARWMLYGGHRNGNKATGYWQSDAQNNHRWHRDAGLALAALAVADEPGADWLLAQTREELEFVARWLPEDGSSHESPSYLVFGMPYLVLAFDAADRCLGTQLLRHPFFKNTLLFRMHTLTPGLKDAFCFGDAGGTGFINNYLFRCASAHRAADLQAGARRFFDADSTPSFQYGWFSLVWFDPSLKGGSLDAVPKNALFGDLGLACMRDGWDARDVALMFKCGPYGGRLLNDFRNQTGKYINVAHDDPDANMLVLWAGGRFLADDDRFAYNKTASAHNTLLLNGKGQRGEGRGHWTQPIGGVDMNTLARIVTWKDAGPAVVVEGEAGNAYAGLERFRRAVVWVPGGYILLLDDIRARAEADLSWLLQGPEVEPLDAQRGLFRLGAAPAICPVSVASNTTYSAGLGASPADDRGKPLGFKQLRLSAKARVWRLAALLDPWNRGATVLLEPADGETFTVKVSAAGFADTWTWAPSPDAATPATLKGERAGGWTVLVGPADRAP